MTLARLFPYSGWLQFILLENEIGASELALVVATFSSV